MARSVLPHALTRREWIENELDPARALKVADAYLEQGRAAESIVFLGKAKAFDRLRELVNSAVQQGDAFLLREASRALGEEPSSEQWRRLAESATALGKERYALEAVRQAERLEE
jgi:hydroxymethylglutaryl-CoA reductase